MSDGSNTPITPAGNILSVLDSIEATLKRGGTGDALALRSKFMLGLHLCTL